MDGKIYEAEIMSLNAKEEKYIVQFVGYENTEEVMLQQLQPSEGHQARLAQIQESQTSHYQVCCIVPYFVRRMNICVFN